MAISFIIQKKIISIVATLGIKLAYLIFGERTIIILKIPIDSHTKEGNSV